jgi:3'(2'),5'-bisphosphate nucleotidase
VDNGENSVSPDKNASESAVRDYRKPHPARYSTVEKRPLKQGILMDDNELRELAGSLVHTAQSAGELILRYREANSEVSFKDDGSPVTDADRAAEELILNDLARLAPGVLVVAEESAAVIGDRLDPDKPFFLVDPLDGTRDFVRGGNDFTVNIALIEGRQPVFGLIYVPVSGRLYFTPAHGEAVSGHLPPSRGEPAKPLELTPLRTRQPDMAKLTVLASRSHMNEKTSQFIARHNVAEMLQFSSSLKFCVIAEGRADLYARLAPTCEWDTAAGHAILQAAGGVVLDLDGDPLAYGKVEKGLINSGFIAWGRQV